MRSKLTLPLPCRLLNRALLLEIGLLALVSQLHVTPTVHKLMLCLIVGTFYGVMGLWVGANEAALDEEITPQNGPLPADDQTGRVLPAPQPYRRAGVLLARGHRRA